MVGGEDQRGFEKRRRDAAGGNEAEVRVEGYSGWNATLGNFDVRTGVSVEEEGNRKSRRIGQAARQDRAEATNGLWLGLGKRGVSWSRR